MSLTNIINSIDNIEQELGVDPQGIYANVRIRLDILESRIGGYYGPPINETAGGDLSGLYPSPTVVGLQNNPVESGFLGLAQDGYVLTWNNFNRQWEALPSTGGSGGFTAGGDLSGSSINQTVIGLQNNPILAGTLGAGQTGYVLTWDGTEWEAEPSAGSFSLVTNFLLMGC